MKTLSYETYNKNRIKIVDAILHYERIRMNGESATRQNCPLCQKFNNNRCHYSNPCERCPIFEVTGENFCSGTPYKDLVHHTRTSHENSNIMNKQKYCTIIYLNCTPL